MQGPDSHRSATRPTRRARFKAGGQPHWSRGGFAVAIAVILIAVIHPVGWAAPKPKKVAGNPPNAQPFVKPLTAEERASLLVDLEAMGVHCTPYVRFSYDMPEVQAGKLMVEIRGTGPVSEALEELERLGNDVLELRLLPPKGQPDSGPGHFTDADFYLIGRLQGLEILRLQTLAIPPRAIEQLAGLPKLSWIEIKGCDGVTNDTLRQVAACRGLTELKLGTKAESTAEGFAHLPRLKSLKRLTVQGPAVPDDVAAELARCKALESLSIYGSTFSDEGLRLVADLKHLHSLSLYNANVSTVGLRHLQPRRLKTLGLTSCPQLGDDSLDVIGGFSSLVSLWLQDISLTDAGLKPLNDLGKLQGLGLVNNSYVTGSGLVSLTALGKLRFLTISGESVSDELFPHLHQLTALENLTVGSGTKTVNSKITDGGIKSIGSMPELFVIAFEGTGVTREGLEPLATQPKLLQVHLSAPGGPMTRVVIRTNWSPK